MASRSLTARVLIVATAWVAVALVVIAVVITQLYRNGAERAFAELLRAQLYNVINSITVGKDTRLEGTPQLGDLRFAQPETGWYWIVEPLGDYKAPPISSISLGAGSVPIVPTTTVPFDARYERSYQAKDSFGNDVLVSETEVLLDSQGRAARFRVVGNRDVVESDIATFSRQVFVVFAIFGLASLAVNAVAILYGLRPLDAVRRALERVRDGEAQALEGVFPREIAPLAAEVNALIDSNRRIVERARMQVGNLAHSLKTPIAVLINETRALDPGPARLIRGQVETMQTQVQSYLDRARIAAQKGTVLARTDPAPALERLARVMRRLHPALTFDLAVAAGVPAVALEVQDLEEVAGNLLDNASKFAATRVAIRLARAQASTDARQRMISLVIEDDGPGLSPEEAREALKRGRRLDESKPGTGLGLSIVSEIVGEYRGSLALDRASIGGLKATVLLPAVTETLAEG